MVSEHAFPQNREVRCCTLTSVRNLVAVMVDCHRRLERLIQPFVWPKTADQILTRPAPQEDLKHATRGQPIGMRVRPE